MVRLLRLIVSVVLICGLGSCVFENDMSYPRLKGEIIAFEVEGQKETIINSDSLTVSVLLEETADIDSLKLVQFAISDLAVPDKQLGDYLNLQDTIDITLSTYPGQDYRWTISAQQPIERYIKCNGFIDAQFNAEQRTVLVSVIEQPLDDLLIQDMKLGPETSKIVSTTGYDGAVLGETTKSVTFPIRLDCTLTRKFVVLYKDVEYEWSVTFTQQKVVNEIKSVDAWTYHAYVEGDYDGSGAPYFEYRKASDTEWLPCNDVQVEGVRVKADLSELEEGTDYSVRLVSADAVGEEFAFRTDTPVQLDGMAFNEWHMGGKNGKTIYPYAEGNTSPTWDTANPGISSLIENTTVPEYTHKVEGEAAAKMVSSIAVVKFAAGNIFTGKFLEFKDMVATLEWGVPFTSRPHSLKGWYDYSPGMIDRDEMGKYPELLGQPDIMQIMVALVAEDDGINKGPFQVLSNMPGKPDLQNDPRVIAFNEILSSEHTGGNYVEFELPLIYKPGDTRKPAYAVVVACASYRGNFFTGAVGSTLYVDDFKFTYR